MEDVSNSIIRFDITSGYKLAHYEEPEFGSSRMNRMCELLAQERFVDICLISKEDGTRVPAHRFVLSASSDYFFAMLDSKMEESRNFDVPIDGIRGDVLNDIVKFCYTGKIQIKEETAVDLLRSAHLCFFANIVKACEHFLVMHVSVDNFGEMLQLARLYNCHMLMETIDRLQKEYILEIYKTSEFLNDGLENVTKIIESSELDINIEEDVYEIIEKWVEHDLDLRKDYVPQLLLSLRYKFLSVKFISERIQSKWNSIEATEILEEAIKVSKDPNYEEGISKVVFNNNSRRYRDSSIFCYECKSRTIYCLRCKENWEVVHTYKDDTVVKSHIDGHILYCCRWDDIYVANLNKKPYNEVLFYQLGLATAAAIFSDATNLYVMREYHDEDDVEMDNALKSLIVIDIATKTAIKTLEMDFFTWSPEIPVINNCLYITEVYDIAAPKFAIRQINLATMEAVRVQSSENMDTPLYLLECDGELYGVSQMSAEEGILRGRGKFPEMKKYDTMTNTWKLVSPMKIQRKNPSFVIHKGSILVFGGLEFTNVYLREKRVEIYNCQNNTWSFMPSLPTIESSASLRD